MGTRAGVDDDGRDVELTGDDCGGAGGIRSAAKTKDGTRGRTRDQARVGGGATVRHHLGRAVYDDITSDGHVIEPEHTEGAIGRKTRQRGIREATDSWVDIGARTRDSEVLREGTTRSKNL